MHTCTNTRMCALVAADAETLPLCSGHGVPDAVIDDHFKASAEMFAQLTQDEKQMLKVNAPPAATLASTSAAKETKVQGFPPQAARFTVCLHPSVLVLQLDMSAYQDRSGCCRDLACTQLRILSISSPGLRAAGRTGLTTRSPALAEARCFVKDSISGLRARRASTRRDTRRWT